MTETVKIEELNTFLPLASLEVLPAEDQKMRLQYWKEHFSSKEILEAGQSHEKYSLISSRYTR
jgi:uncharacterized membrane protein